MIGRWKRNVRAIAQDVVGCITLYWLFIELSSYTTAGQVDTYARSPKIYFSVFTLIAIGSLWKNRPKTTFMSKIRGKDMFVEIKVGDAFDNQGALIIPFNNHFDTSLNGNVAKAKSLQNRLVHDYYDAKSQHLQTDLKAKGIKDKAYPIGTTVEIDSHNKRFYLLVNSVKTETGRVKASVDDLILSLSGAWDYIANESSRNKTLTIPLLNTGHGRDPSLTKMATAKEIIASYVEASKQVSVCEKLIISIHPEDVENGLIDLDDLNDYLRSATSHYREVTLAPHTNGEGDTSKVVNIES
jgi:hypothetical protein